MCLHVHVHGHVDWLPNASNQERDGRTRLISGLIPAQGVPRQSPGASAHEITAPNSAWAAGASSASWHPPASSRGGRVEKRDGGRAWRRTGGWPQGLDSWARARSSPTSPLRTQEPGC